MTARTVNQGGGPAPDYATLNAAVAASNPTGDTIEVQGTWSAADTTKVAYNAAVVVTADADAKQIGRPFQSGDTHYRHRATGSSGSDHSFTVTDDVDITDLDIQGDQTGVSAELFRASSSAWSSIKLTNCMLGFTGNTDQQDCVYFEGAATQTIEFEQCFFYDIGRSIVDQYGSSAASIFTIKFTACASQNIGANTGRANAAWVGIDNIADSDCTVDVFAHSCLIHYNTTVYAFRNASTTGTFDVECNYSLTHETDETRFLENEDNNDLTGMGYNYVWTTSTTPGVGNWVIQANLTSGTYDPILIDDSDNDAIGYHAIETDAGLTIPDLDITGKTRDKTTPSFDVGPHTITVAAAGGGSVPAMLQNQVRTGFWPPAFLAVSILLNKLITNVRQSRREFLRFWS